MPFFNIYDGEAIGYNFGNREVLLRYLKIFPDQSKDVLIGSFKSLKYNEFIDLFPQNELITKDEYQEFLAELDFYGYDFLKKRVSALFKCDNDEHYTLLLNN